MPSQAKGDTVQGRKGGAVVQYSHGQMPCQVGSARIKLQIFCYLHLMQKTEQALLSSSQYWEKQEDGSLLPVLGEQLYSLHRDNFCKCRGILTNTVSNLLFLHSGIVRSLAASSTPSTQEHHTNTLQQARKAFPVTRP